MFQKRSRYSIAVFTSGIGYEVKSRRFDLVLFFVVIEPILVLNLVGARSSWLGIGTEPPADRSPIRRRIV